MKNAESVKINGREVSLELTYCVANVESDTVIFREYTGGRLGYTQEEAIAEVISMAKAWAVNERAEGRDVGAWDDSGNNY